MGRRKRTLPDGQVRPLRKGLHPYSNKVMSPRSPYQTESLEEEDLQSKPLLMPHVNYNTKNKFFPQPDQKTTATPSSNLKHQARDMLLPPAEHREKTVSLPQLDHPIIAKSSLPKHLNKTTVLPLKCLDCKDGENSVSLARPKHWCDPDTWAEPPSHPNKLPKVPLAPNHLSKIQQASEHCTGALLYRSQQLRHSSYPDSQDNTRIYADYKRRTTPMSPLCSKFETKTTTLQLPCHSHHSKASQNLTVYQKAKTSLLQCQNHRLRVQPLPCTDYSFKTKAKPLSGPNRWARDIAVPSPCPMHGSTMMVVQCIGSNNSERTRTMSTGPNHSSIPIQCNQPSSVPSSVPELPLRDADYKVKEISIPLPHPEQEAVFSIDSEHQIEAGQDDSPKITVSSLDSDQSALIPLHPNQWTKIVSDPDQCIEALQDPNFKAESALNQEKCVEIIPQVETQVNQDCRIKSPTGLRYQVEVLTEPDQQGYPLPDIKEKVKTEMELGEQVDPRKSYCEQAQDESRPKHWGEIPLVPEQQDQILSAQDHQLEVTSDHYQGTTTLLVPRYRTEAQLGCDHLSGVKAKNQATSPLGMHHLGEGSSNLKTQATSLPDPDLDDKPPCAELQATTITGHTQQEKTPADSRFLALPHESLNHWGKIPTYNEDGVELLPSAYYHANAVQKIESSWCFLYIKPYIIEGGTISDGTVDKIINSIPQEKIKNDIQKILLEQTKGCPAPQTGHSLSSNYNICLLCASWIPHGCCHVNEINYHCCKAQLVATPTLIAGSKVKIAIKFVLKLPKQQPSSTFCLTLPRYDMPGPSKPLLPFPSPFCSDTTPHWKAPMVTWFDYICGKNHYLTERQTSRSQRSFLGKMSEQSNATGEEEARGSGRVFKSLLEKFQRKRRTN
ncbi:uncharacterized protein LOC118835991 isoform X2 [Trichosurus vulpecula]|uniref:uncharacterized protein LOC118835991 isoform X2 n=1 Tax=Trichosurus vulpecula TaxID=9337 RepID=UPI00186B5578|nr:uncharacterized protein LOC118835991 isoform X2 [Trichosurus vulpecula]XP_036599218.1 uncharacterized protein LOC118835991 isoform X2 [Trichosurus vulpecula]